MPWPTTSFPILSAILAISLNAAPGNAADEGQLMADLEDIEPVRCREISIKPDGAVLEATPDLADSVITNLVVEAVLRFCGSIGAIEPPERIVRDDTRNADPSADLTQGQRDVLRQEAEYHLEVATSIDADAANALLRRLLGPEPKPSQ